MIRKTFKLLGNRSVALNLQHRHEAAPPQFSALELERIVKQPDGQAKLFALVREGIIDLDFAAEVIARAQSTAHGRLRRFALLIGEALLPTESFHRQ